MLFKELNQCFEVLVETGVDNQVCIIEIEVIDNLFHEVHYVAVCVNSALNMLLELLVIRAK